MSARQTFVHLTRRLRSAIASGFRGRPWLAVAGALLLAVALFGATGLAAWFTADVTLQLPGKDAVRDLGDMATATTLYDVQDRPVFTIFKEQRIEVPLSRISPHLQKAVIAVEDQRFYEHRGIDAVRVVAAALANLRSGRRSQGGSTITQQLARQSLLTRDKTYRRKLKEVLLAAQIEKSYSKEEILEMYLNKVYFGDGFHGIEAASLGYLGKHASELDVADAALLAGLIQSPSAYAPTVNLERAIARRQIVLAAMRATGAIDDAAYQQAKEARVQLHDGLQRDEPFGLYFKELVRRELVDRFGWERVSEGGLKVYTTIDATLQPQVEALLEDGIEDIEKRRGYPHEPRAVLEPIQADTTPDYLQGAVIVMDVATGEVRALVGGRDFKEGRFNRATQAKRQAGSAFKPFVYAAAVEGGMMPGSVLTNLNDPVLTPQGDWIPEDEHSSASSMTLRTALRTSSNRAAVQLLRTVGMDRAMRTIKQFDFDVPAVPALALGAGDVTLTSMTAAFGVFASGGIARRPIFIRRVEDRDGKVIWSAVDRSNRVISETTAFLMSQMLADVITRGTGYRARQAGFTLPAAGKTGTTNDYRDVWFVGYTPRLVTGVWLGFDQPKPIISNGYAGELAVPLWAQIMKVATKGDKPEWYKPPSGLVAVQICSMSGKLPNEGCSSVEVMRDTGEIDVRNMVYTEYFVRGRAPTAICDLHPGRSWLDKVAGVFGAEGQKPVAESQAEAAVPASPTTARPEASGSASAVHQGTSSATAQPDTARQEPAPKKRGFWSRLFGRGDDKDKKNEKKKEPEKPKPRKPGQ